MATLLGKNQYPPGTKNSIQYTWDFGKFEIRTYEKNFTVSDNEIELREGKYFFYPSKQNPRYTLKEIEIPSSVIDRKNKLNMDLKLKKESISSIDNKAGKIYFSLNSEGKIVAKLCEKEAIADIEDVENRKAINVQSLGLEFPYLEVPADVEKAFMKAKNSKIMENVRLIYAGKSLLTGKDYFKFNNVIPVPEWDCVEEYFEDFGSGSGRTGELKGWVTCMPEKVEAALGLKTTVGNRKKEIDIRSDDVKKFDEAIAKLEK